MKNIGIKLSLFLNYFVFAFLLNSVGAVILQVQRAYSIEKDAASILEGFKDIPIAIAAFVLASFLPRIGLKKAMLLGLLVVALFCFLTPFSNDFWFFKILFAAIGVSFALIKVSVFATIGLITKNEKEHGSFMGILEAVFMGGILLGNVLFSFFIDDANPKSDYWLNIYWLMGAVSLLAFFVLLFTRLNESEAKIEARSLKEDFKEMFVIAFKPLVLIFVASIFLYVLVEQSFSTWFPTFYEGILKTPASMAIQAGAILAGVTMIGRFMAGIILSRIKWIYVLSTCLIIVAIIVLTALPLANSVTIDPTISWINAPLVVYLMPLMGLFLAPIYQFNHTFLPSKAHAQFDGGPNCRFLGIGGNHRVYHYWKHF